VILLSGKSVGCCRSWGFDTVSGGGDTVDTVPHLLQSFAVHLWDSGLPSRHLVMPSIQSTPPCREQHPLQSACVDTVINDRERVMTRDMRRGSFFKIQQRSKIIRLRPPHAVYRPGGFLILFS